MAKVVVYEWKVWDQRKGEMVTRTVKGALEAIRACNGVAKMDTAEEVDECVLDGNGFLVTK